MRLFRTGWGSALRHCSPFPALPFRWRAASERITSERKGQVPEHEALMEAWSSADIVWAGERFSHTEREMEKRGGRPVGVPAAPQVRASKEMAAQVQTDLGAQLWSSSLREWGLSTDCSHVRRTPLSY